MEVLGAVSDLPDELGHGVQRVPLATDEELVGSGIDERLRCDDISLLERLLALLRSRFQRGNLFGPRGAFGHRLAQHHHLGQLADGDRRHWQPERLELRIAERGCLRFRGDAVLRDVRGRADTEHAAILRGLHARSPREHADSVAARPIHVSRGRDQHGRLAGRPARRRDVMTIRFEPGDPLVDVVDIRGLDRRDRMRGDRAQPLAEPVPLLLGQEALRIALVHGVRKQQGHDVFPGPDLADAAFLRAMAEQLDAVLPVLEALVHRLRLRVAQVGMRNREAILGLGQFRQTFNRSTHHTLSLPVAGDTNPRKLAPDHPRDCGLPQDHAAGGSLGERQVCPVPFVPTSQSVESR